MDVVVKGMEMPKVCVEESGYCGSCPMDRMWCGQMFAPKRMTTGEIYEAQQNKLPDWCPLIEVKEGEEGMYEIVYRKERE